MHTDDTKPGTEVSYSGAMSAVSGLLFEARVRGPALLLLHWGFGDRFSFAREASALAKCGVTCLTIDAPGMGARGKGLPRLDRTELAIAFIRECLEDLKAGIDFLIGHPNVDAARLGYVGHSLGAALAGQFAAAEPRLVAVAALTGPGRLAPVWSLNPDDAYESALQPFDGARLIGQSKARFLFQIAARDSFVATENAQSLFDAATGAKTLKRYDCGHSLNGSARIDRAHWLAETLGFSVGENDAVWRNARLPVRDLIKYGLTSAVMSVMGRGRRG